MPELPEVETICRGLAAHIEGRRIAGVDVRRGDLRFPLPADFARRLAGRQVEAVSRRAKYMLWRLDDGTMVVGHMGMSGRMTVLNGAPLPIETHDHLVFRFDDGQEVRFHDPRRFGYFDLSTAEGLDDHRFFRALGPEPLGNAFNADALQAALTGRRTSIKAALLDQRVVAGLGNIYVCEALYLSRLSPLRRSDTVVGSRAENLVAAIRAVLNAAIDAGGSSLRDYVQASGELGYFQHNFSVYGRAGEACPACAAAATPCSIRRVVQQGRSTFYCSRRQR